MRSPAGRSWSGGSGDTGAFADWLRQLHGWNLEGSAITARAGRDCGGLIRGNDGLIGDGGEPAGTGSVQFICVVPVGRNRAGARSGRSRRNARGALRDRICLLP
jgi:hypothetical protein